MCNAQPLICREASLAVAKTFPCHTKTFEGGVIADNDGDKEMKSGISEIIKGGKKGGGGDREISIRSLTTHVIIQG